MRNEKTKKKEVEQTKQNSGAPFRKRYHLALQT